MRCIGVPVYMKKEMPPCCYCIPRRKLGTLCICYCYAATTAAAAATATKISCVHPTHWSFFKFKSYVPSTKVKMSINFGHSTISFVASGGPDAFFLCALYRDQSFQMIFFPVNTKYALNQGLEANQFSAPCSSICSHQIHLFLVCTVNPRVFN